MGKIITVEDISQTVSEISKIFLAAGNLEEMYPLLTEALCGKLGFSYASIELFDKDSMTGRCAGRFGAADSEAVGVAYSLDNSLSFKLVSGGKPVCITGGAGAGGTPEMDKLRLKSLICAPISVAGSVAGAVSVGSGDGREDAQLCAIAVEAAAGHLSVELGGSEIKEQLEYAANGYRNLFDCVNDAIFIHDFDGKIMEVNRAACERYGYVREEFRTMSISELDTTEHAEEIPDKIAELLIKGALLFEVEHRRRDGTVFPVEISSKPIEYKSVPAVASIARDITGRIAMQAMLGESAERLILMFDGAGEGIIYFDEDGKIREINKKILEISGCSREEIIGLDVISMAKKFHADTARAAKDYGRLIETGKPQDSTKWHIRNKKGENLVITARTGTITKGDGNIGLTVLIQDITAQEQAEEALIENELKYRRLFEVESDAIFLFDKETGRIIEANPAAAALYGYSRDELMSLRNADLSDEPAGPGQPAEDMWAEIPVRYHRKKDGAVFPVEIKMSRFTWHGGNVLLAAVRDITRRLKTQMAFVEERDKLKQILDNMNAGIYIGDDKYNISYINPLLEKEFGPLEGRKCHEYFHGEPGPCPWCRGVEVISGGPYRWEWDCKEKGRVYDVINEPIKNGDDSFNKIVVFHDITERKAAEAEREKLQQQLFQAQKMDAIGQLAGGIAHDFNNMLAVIMGNANLVQSDLKRDAAGHEEMREILSAADRARELTMKLLTFARKEKIDIREADPKEIAESVIMLVERGLAKKIKIKKKLAGGLAIECDPGQIEQVLLNICANAKDAMPGGGVLAIECRKETFRDEKCDSCGELIEGDYCVFAVRDTGIGIPESMVAKVFEPFFSTKGQAGGGGLGLSVSLGIVENHGGHIRITSAPGAGTEVAVMIPMGVPAPGPVGADAQRAEIGRCGETILIVDDEVPILKMSEKIMKKAGYTVIAVSNPVEAVEIVRRHGKEIALVLLDMIMPEMDGKDVYFAIREIAPDMKFLLCSGYAPDAKIRAFIKDKGVGFVQKPFSTHTLYDALRNVLDGS